MERPTSKKTKEPPKRANHKGNIKFPNPFMLQERGGPLKRMPSLKEQSPTTTCLKTNAHAHTITPLTPFIYIMCAKLKEESF